MDFIDRTGEENYNSFGTLMKIIEYKNARDITIEFQDKYHARVRTNYNAFKKGNVKNPYGREVYCIGYYGEGKYKARENGKMTNVYYSWIRMLERCYNPYYLNKHPTYINCYVCEEWHNFQNFAKWYEDNYYNCNDDRMELDKDILYRENRIYSPETCVFVPQRINKLLIKRQNDRGKYPIGVSYHKCSDSLVVGCNTFDLNGKYKREHLGSFPLNRPFQAFYCYKQFKEKIIKQVADEYKDLIPNKLYEALYKWEVEIND